MLEDKTEKANEGVDEEESPCVDWNGYKSLVLLDRRMMLPVAKSFTENPKGSNSTETLFS